MSTTAAPRFLTLPWKTPPMIARQLGCKPDRVIGWIRSGQLRGIDLAEPGSKRPRFRVDPVDLEVFLNTRAVAPAAKPTRRRRQPADVVEYF